MHDAGAKPDVGVDVGDEGVAGPGGGAGGGLGANAEGAECSVAPTDPSAVSKVDALQTPISVPRVTAPPPAEFTELAV